VKKGTCSAWFISLLSQSWLFTDCLPIWVDFFGKTGQHWNQEKIQALNHYLVFANLCRILSPLYPFNLGNSLQILLILPWGFLLLASCGCTRCGSNIEEMTDRLRILISRMSGLMIFILISLTESPWNEFCYFLGKEKFLRQWSHHLICFLTSHNYCIEGFWKHFYVLNLCFFSCLMLVFLLTSIKVYKNFFGFFCRMISLKAMLNCFMISLSFIYS
jgi:hypothetical protein